MPTKTAKTIEAKELFAAAAEKYYFFHAPKELGQQLGALVLEAFESKDDLAERGLAVAAGMWAQGFRFSLAKDILFNKNWSVDYPPRKEPEEIYEILIEAGEKVLRTPEDTVEFQKTELYQACYTKNNGTFSESSSPTTLSGASS